MTQISAEMTPVGLVTVGHKLPSEDNMTDKDLFGEPVYPGHKGNGKRGRGANKKGYAASPGSGPEGEKCRSCKNICRSPSESGTNFFKCGLLRRHWTRGAGTDILAGSSACRYWEPWEQKHYNGVIVRVHKDFPPEESHDNGKTWNRIKGRERAHEPSRRAGVHSLP